MSNDDPTILHGTLCAVRNHMDAHRGKTLTARQIHELLYEWPQLPPPLDLTLTALAILETQGYIEPVEQDGQEFWRRTP